MPTKSKSPAKKTTKKPAAKKTVKKTPIAKKPATKKSRTSHCFLNKLKTYIPSKILPRLHQ